VIHNVIYEPEARNDLFDIYDFIAERADPVTAFNYVERIQASCESLATFPLRGTAADDIRPGLRFVGFERRVSIASAVVGRSVRILRVLYGGRNLTKFDFEAL
jgi:toxin ParE1/3/4